MKIQESTVTLSASHEASRQHSIETTSELSFRRVFAQAASQPATSQTTLQQRVQRLLESLVAAIMAAIDGRPCQENLAAGDPLPEAGTTPAAPAGREISWRYEVTERLHERESTQVCGQGTVTTCDGRQIAFAVDLSLNREMTRESVLAGSGTIELRDPLVLSFDGRSCELTGERFAFDLDADGCPEQIPGLGEGSCFLVFDRNGNGRADDGRELFGARSGDGFADLAVLDDDGNGWIDEADAAFGRLALWSGKDWQSLAAGGIGALYTAAVDAPFSLKTANDELLGQIRAAGVYLTEAGQAGFMQQVDLAVSAPGATRHEQPEQGEQLAA